MILVDGNSIGHACFHTEKLSVGGQDVQMIFGMVRSLQALAEKHPEKKIIVLWDGRAQFRYDLYPEYKSNRKPLDEKQKAEKEDYRRQALEAESIIQVMGISQMRDPGLEADDLAGQIVANKRPDEFIQLISGDQDWLQLVSPTVSWYDPIRVRTVTYENFAEFTGYPDPVAYLDGKCLRGDNSDGISGVGGIGEKGARDLMTDFGSVKGLLQAMQSGEFKPTKKAILNFATKDGIALYKRNQDLMNLTRGPKTSPDTLQVTRGAFDPEQFENVCRTYNFASILRDFDNFIAPLQPKTTKAAA